MKVKALLVLVLVVAFVSSCTVITEPDLSVPQLVFEDEFDDYWPSLSPDGRYLAFLSDRDGESPRYQSLLCMYGYDKNEVTVHTDYYNDEQYGLDVSQVEWSVDGQWLFFCREYYTLDDEGTQLCRIPLGGSEQDVEVLQENIHYFTVHPDGSKVAVLYYGYHVGPYLAEVEVSSGEMTIIENTADIGFKSISYSQDGEAVIAHLYSEYAPQFGADIVSFPVDGSEPVGLASLDWEQNGGLERFDISATREEMIFSDRDRAVTVIPVSGGESYYPVPIEYSDPLTVAWEDDGYLYFVDGGIWRFKPEL